MEERIFQNLGRSGLFFVEQEADDQDGVVSLADRRDAQVNRFPPEFYQYFSLDVAS